MPGGKDIRARQAGRVEDAIRELRALELAKPPPEVLAGSLSGLADGVAGASQLDVALEYPNRAIRQSRKRIITSNGRQFFNDWNVTRMRSRISLARSNSKPEAIDETLLIPSSRRFGLTRPGTAGNRPSAPGA